ncbi:MAG TPA: hypothetical protein VGQ83_30920 [Polyangia bacterium]
MPALVAALATVGPEAERRPYSRAHKATVAGLRRKLGAAKGKPTSFADLCALLQRELGFAELALAGLRALFADAASAGSHQGTVRVPNRGDGPPLLWAGDLVVHGDLENGHAVIVTGDLTIDGTYRQWRADAPLLLVGGHLDVRSVEAFGPVLVLGDLTARTMYVGGSDHRLDVGGALAAELLIQHDHEIGAGRLEAAHHLTRPPAVYDARGRLDLEAILARLAAGEGLPGEGEDEAEGDEAAADELGVGDLDEEGLEDLAEDAAAADEPVDAASDAELLLRRLVKEGHLELERGCRVGLLVPGLDQVLERARSPEHAARQVAAWLEDQDAVAELYIGDRELEALIRDTLQG